MPHEEVTIATPDGACPAGVFTANDGGRGGEHPCPAILFYMDAGGVRPAVQGMASRLADAGYVVLLPDLFYRYGPYGPLVPAEVFAGDLAAILGPLMATTGNAVAASDTRAFLSFLDRREDVLGDNVGAVGFCMGAGMAIAAAGTCSDRIAAVASFHGGSLATDAPDSPHRYASKLQAKLYIAAAQGDDLYPPAMAEAFKRSLSEENVRYTHKTYPAAHGWMKPDFPAYDEAAAEQGWREMIAFFDETLKPH